MDDPVFPDAGDAADASSGGGGGGGAGGGARGGTAKTPDGQRFLQCVRGDADYFSLHNLLAGATNGQIGNGPIASFLLGSSVSLGTELLEFGLSQAGAGRQVTQELMLAAAKEGTDEALEFGSKHLLRDLPWTVNPSFYLGTDLIRLPDISGSFPLQSIGNGAAKGLSAFGRTIALPWDLAISSFSAVLCGMK